MTTKTKLALGLAAVLLPALFVAARYNGARVRPSDFRDAVKSEGAADELQKSGPGEGDLNALKMPSPEVAISEKGVPASAADQGVKRVFSENDPLHRRVAEALGINYPCTVETKRLGAWYQLAEKATFDDGRSKETVVIKKGHTFPAWTLGSYLWAAWTRALSLSQRVEEPNAVKMFKNGLAMNGKFKAAGLKVLEIVVAEPEKTILVTKFLKGTDLGEIFKAAVQGDAGALQNIGQVGSALATAHRNSLTVGDLNAGNVMFAGGEPCFIDLDRAAPGVHKGWDIALFFYDPILRLGLSGEPEAWALIARTFLKSYLAGGGEPDAVKDALDRRYIGPIAYVYVMKGRSLTRAVRREMKKAAKEDPSQDPEEALGLAQ